MFSIGEFSRLCQVTTKTLRHYDAEGLLIPARVSEETGYRYYDASQFRDMLLILRLKSYGFRLDEIKPLLQADSHVLRARISVKYAEQKKELRQRKSLLYSMERDMEKIEKGMDIMETKVEIKVVETPPVNMISARDTISIKNFDQLFGRAFDKLHSAGLCLNGPVLAIYHSEDFDPESTDVEVGLTVDAGTEDTRVLDGGTCAMAVNLGPYSNLHETYTALAKWVEENGYKITASPYEKYLNSPQEVSEEQLVTEVYFPISK